MNTITVIASRSASGTALNINPKYIRNSSLETSSGL